MKLPLRIHVQGNWRRVVSAAAIALPCAVLGVLLWATAEKAAPLRLLDNVFYDSFYRFRTVAPQTGGPVVIVAVDDASIEAVDKGKGFGWPWPREFYGHMVRYLGKAGATAVVFDLLFDRSSVYNNASDDDKQFADLVDGASVPVVLATVVRPDGSNWGVSPPLKQKILGAANVSREDLIRWYNPRVHGTPSLALEALSRGGKETPTWAGQPFLLHYYGPHADATNQPVTFRYIRAANLLAAALEPGKAGAVGIDPSTFRGKTVFIATITAGTYDLKSSPLSAKYPGVEVHATALQNMVSGQRVQPVGMLGVLLTSLLACMAGSLLTILPGRMPVKVAGALGGPLVVLGTATALFLPASIRWLAPAGPLVASLGCGFASLGFSYLTELRQRKFVQKALAQYISREVAEEVFKDPRKLSLGGQRREMTVMFTDLANFTSLSESVEVEKLEAMLHLYLEEMSGVVFDQNGTLDKYIGDSIMSFWNAPAFQPDHARRACLAALEMRRREELLKPRLLEMAGRPIYSRLGINTGPMVVGNMGSTYKFDYTVLGDSVNLASRLEGANKMYGTRVLIAQTTAELVKEEFVLRKVDLVRVKGKTRPLAVYELMGQGAPDETQAGLIKRYAAALGLYQAGDFSRAHEVLIALANDFPEDGPTATLLARVVVLLRDPPEGAWDGVYVAKEK